MRISNLLRCVYYSIRDIYNLVMGVSGFLIGIVFTIMGIYQIHIRFDQGPIYIGIYEALSVAQSDLRLMRGIHESVSNAGTP